MVRNARFASAVSSAASGPQALLEPVAENDKKRLGIVAIGNMDHAPAARQGFQFTCLIHIPIHKNQEFRWFAALIAAHDDIARKQRQYFFGRDFLADRGHPQKRAQRAGDGDFLRGRGTSGSGRLRRSGGVRSGTLRGGLEVTRPRNAHQSP